MGPEAHTSAALARGAATSDPAPRCPHCRGAVRLDAPWCTQCWADLRPPPVPDPPVPDPAAPIAPGGALPGDPDRSAPVGRGLGGWPCSGCGTVNDVERDACVACGTGFLAGLRRSEPPLLVLPGVGDVTRLSRVQRLGLAAAAVLLVLLAVALIALVTG